MTEALVDALAAARIGETFNQYTGCRLLRQRLFAYLETRRDAPVLLVGEAAGYRGARVSGLPFTSERQLTGSGPAEATATIVHRVLAARGLEDRVVLWNVVPTHPHRPGAPNSNRRPTRPEVETSLPFLEALAPGRRVVAVGRLAAAVLDAPYVRHPSHGGAQDFEAALVELLAGGS
jgi:uracil-DNA glycosylase